MMEEWQKVLGHRAGRAGDCLLFLGAKGQNGYGHLRYQGANWTAHRLSYRLAIAEIPSSMIVMHSCDNPACIAPAHLSVGSLSDNTRDMVIKRRHGWVTKPGNFANVRPPHLRGSANGSAKLTDVIVRNVRKDHSDGCSYKTLAEVYGISKTTVAQIIRRETWTHI